jgi:glycosyltransferase involved in cell wall biosynthesis
MVRSISIIIPVNGEAPFLADAIASVERQTLREFDLIIVLDRPSEATRSFVESLAKKDFEIKVLESYPPGISAALNKGISTTESKYIARLDSDDLMQPTRLQMQVAELEKNPNLVCIGSQVDYIDKEGRTTGHSSLPTSAWQVRSMMPTLNCLMHPSVMIRRSALVSAGGYREYLDGVEDYNLWLRLLRFGSLKNHKEYLTKYRRHPSQVTQANFSIYPWLDALARLDALEQQVPRGARVWSEHLKSLKENELEPLVRKLESQAASPWTRNLLRSSRSFSLYFVGPRNQRLQNITKALLRTPFRTVWLAILVTVQKVKSL